MELMSPERNLEDSCKLIGSSFGDEHSNLINGYTYMPDGSLQNSSEAPCGETMIDPASQFSNIASLDEQCRDFVDDGLHYSVLGPNPASPLLIEKQTELYPRAEFCEENDNLLQDGTVYASEQQFENFAVNQKDGEVDTHGSRFCDRVDYLDDSKSFGAAVDDILFTGVGASSPENKSSDISNVANFGVANQKDVEVDTHGSFGSDRAALLDESKNFGASVDDDRLLVDGGASSPGDKVSDIPNLENFGVENQKDFEVDTHGTFDSERADYLGETKNFCASVEDGVLLADGRLPCSEGNNNGIPNPENEIHCSSNTAENENFVGSLGVSQIENMDHENVCEQQFDSTDERKVEDCTGGELPSHEDAIVSDENALPQDQHMDCQVLTGQSLSSKTSSKMQLNIMSPGRLSPVPTERSSHAQQSDKELESCVKDEKEVCRSRSPARRKHSRSPDRHGSTRKRASSHERSSSSKRQKSSGHHSTRDSRRKDDSPRRVSRSPRRRDSPHRRRRSSSRSPARRRDSSRSRRDHHRGKSRSRSPRSKDQRRRSPRRGHSPRHRSPASHSRSHRRSPRRPWSPPANRKNGIGKPGRNLFIAGFSYVTTERDLEKKFSKYGRVTDVRVVRDKRSGDSRGFGFLSLEKDEDADEAIRALDETEWNGRIILVEKSKTGGR